MYFPNRDKVLTIEEKKTKMAADSDQNKCPDT